MVLRSFFGEGSFIGFKFTSPESFGLVYIVPLSYLSLFMHPYSSYAFFLPLRPLHMPSIAAPLQRACIPIPHFPRGPTHLGVFTPTFAVSQDTQAGRRRDAGGTQAGRRRDTGGA